MMKNMVIKQLLLFHWFKLRYHNRNLSNFLYEDIIMTKKTFSVNPQYRTNPLSHIEGGVTVIVEHADGSSLSYDNVKNPRAYIAHIRSKDGVVNAYIKQEEDENKPRQTRLF